MTPNPFLALAQALIKSGSDMEDVALDLAAALKEVISDGLETTIPRTILKEVSYLMHFDNDKTHRPDREPPQF